MKEIYMKQALEEAEKAYKIEEVPVGAIIVRENRIISRAHNMRESLKQSIAHAEILAINMACNELESWRLSDCEMYITLEPCPMCAGAILQSRIRKVYIGASDLRLGSCGSILNILQNDNFNHWVDVEWMYNRECSDILTSFFKMKRKGSI